MNQKPQSFTVFGKIISFNPPLIVPVMSVSLYELRTYGKDWLKVRTMFEKAIEGPKNIPPSTDNQPVMAI